MSSQSCSHGTPDEVEVCATCRATGMDDLSAVRSAVREAWGERYEIVARLGAGSFGEVFKAKDTYLNRMVAVKTIHLNRFADSDHQDTLKKRFVREAQLAAQLQHPNVVTIYDIASTSETSFIIMEFIEGATLQSMLTSRGRLALQETIQILSQVASALDYAHSHQVIHRDVTPANILLSSAGLAKVTDFGVAKSELTSSLTVAGTLLGTPDYMSPEQARGGDVDARSDLFSVGCILYRSLVGEKPFHAGSITGVLLRIVSNDPLPPVDWAGLGLPSGLDSVVRRALAKNPTERFKSGADLVAALSSLSADEASVREPCPPVRGVEPHPQRAQSRLESAVDPTALKEDRRRLAYSPTLSDDLQAVSLSAEQGFILSRIDGTSTPRDVIAMSPLAEDETIRALAWLLERRLVRVEEERVRSNAPHPVPDSPELNATGVGPRRPEGHDAPRQEPIETRAIPTPRATEERTLSHVPPSPREDPGPARSAKHETAPLADVEHQVKKFFAQAEKAYLMQDFWTAIELCRQAVALSPNEAKLHHLLGRALLQNKHWRKEAEEHLQTAARLDPGKPEYFGVLAFIYEREGLRLRANKMLEKAKSIDPSFSLSSLEAALEIK